MPVTPSLSSPKRPFRLLKGMAAGAFAWLGFMLMLAILGPWLATHLPWRAVVNEQVLWPAFFPTDSLIYHGQPQALARVDWQQQPATSLWMAPVPFSPEESQLFGRVKLPPGSFQQDQGRGEGRYRHWLGTTSDGSDLLSQLIHGARTSLLVGLLVTLLTGLLGIFIGGMAGFWGDQSLRLNRLQQGLFWLTWFLIWFYAWRIRQVAWLAKGSPEGQLGQELLLRLGLALLIAGGAWGLGRWLGKQPWAGKPRPFPVDALSLRLMELLDALPGLLLVITVAAFVQGDLWLVIGMLGLLSWSHIARLVRAEMLSLKERAFLQAGKVAGLSPFRLLWRHALPNAFPPALITLAFVFGNGVIAESALSYLAVIKPPVSWGSLLEAAKSDLTSWWLFAFPGLAIFLTVLAANTLGEWMRDRFDPRT